MKDIVAAPINGSMHHADLGRIAALDLALTSPQPRMVSTPQNMFLPEPLVFSWMRHMPYPLGVCMSSSCSGAAIVLGWRL